MLSFVTNSTLQDRSRLNVFIPHVLDVFGPYIDELIIVLDQKKEEGRIRKLHATALPVDGIDDHYCDTLRAMDARIAIVDCDYTRVNEFSEKWFHHPGVIRCQGGTPIYAFIYGIEQCKNDRIVRSDCDIFFLDNGFINNLLTDDQSDIIQLPRLNDEQIGFSSRSFFVRKSKLISKLPLRLYRLDALRRIHRRLLGRATFLALEQIIELNMLKGRIEGSKQSIHLGNTMHIAKREDFLPGPINNVLRKFSLGIIPVRQLQYNHDYQRELWEETLNE